jgi:tyrosinase
MFLTACSGDDETKDQPVSMRVRKNAKDLTAEERADFVNAVLKLKDVPSPYDSSLSYYDQFVMWHHVSSQCPPDGSHVHPVSHMNLAFLPWHRMLVYRFENALREVSGKDISVPYWDWTDPSSEPVVFADDFLGGDGDPNDLYKVKNGPFKVLPVSFPPGSHLPRIVRKFNTHYDADPMKMIPNIDIVLPKPEEVEAVLKIAQFNTAPYDLSVDPAQNFQLALEGWIGFTKMECDPGGKVMFPVGDQNSREVLHSAVHPWVAGFQFFGSMADPPLIKGTMAWSTSPNDPAFFLHHSNIDRIWSQWQTKHGKDKYAPVTGGPPGTNLKEAMMPYPAFADGPNTIEDLLDDGKLNIAYE